VPDKDGFQVLAALLPHPGRIGTDGHSFCDGEGARCREVVSSFDLNDAQLAPPELRFGRRAFESLTAEVDDAVGLHPYCRGQVGVGTEGWYIDTGALRRLQYRFAFLDLDFYIIDSQFHCCHGAAPRRNYSQGSD